MISLSLSRFVCEMALIDDSTSLSACPEDGTNTNHRGNLHRRPKSDD